MNTGRIHSSCVENALSIRPVSRDDDASLSKREPNAVGLQENTFA